uniref:rRNA-processing protein UTP23 homolog n=1 Tax=Lepeophtheirus salmonis TaxID=72036 RepID=D3PH70_LEPSM|nr:rRNA-processing protein UTP23 homolog [Lepeophtheirus salmonis]
MKVKRQRRVRRILNYFRTHFGLKAPYRVLLDGTFCQSCLTAKVNIKEQIPNYLLVPEVRYCTSPCAITETDKLGPQLYGASLILKGLAASYLLECSHGKEPLPAVKCIKSILKDNNSSSSIIVATQDPELRERVRKIPGVPLIYLHGNAPTLEEPSAYTKSFVTKGKNEVSHEEKVILELKEKEFGSQESVIHKKKKRKGVNPLSCLKSKKRLR